MPPRFCAASDTKNAFATQSSDDYRVLYIDDNYAAEATKLANVSGGHSRDVFIHPNTNIVIFDSIQAFYTSLNCRIYLPQTSESASYYSYNQPTSTADYLKYDGSKIQFVFKIGRAHV